MLSEPSVCAIMLTANRPAMARQAVECFRRQTYTNKKLFVADTGERESITAPQGASVYTEYWPGHLGTIGILRNDANLYANPDCLNCDILIHLDDDDYSHPNRIAEQVALLQSSGADAVGYREMLFWREPGSGGVHGCGICEHVMCRCPGEAWLYSNRDPRYALGTSLCYWRKTWEAKPFPALNMGEDAQWISGLKCVGVSSIGEKVPIEWHEPRMIARIHAGNTSTAYRPEVMAATERQGGPWKRAPDWDKYCSEVFNA